jgi:hypothetical protein
MPQLPGGDRSVDAAATDRVLAGLIATDRVPQGEPLGRGVDFLQIEERADNGMAAGAVSR